MRYLKCPNCEMPIESNEIGEMITYSCNLCGWSDFVLIARVFPDMPRSITMSVTVRSSSSPSALAMKTIRSLARSAAEISLGELPERLRAPAGLDLGPQAEYRARELVDLLEPLGFAIESKPYVPNKTIQQTPSGAADQ
ncbi:hypothetical protein [Massilia sp. BJB1822]|uniref:hypothetical protein n=1 Tax=Massilia sp. BJB1822 TaxID=2744470 RepID=UPI001593529E|nr:hypothetical protein [Massilia sp. BJB1822]NVD97810.1 hypothetical protein [Massilia sp. BJB1822]